MRNDLSMRWSEKQREKKQQSEDFRKRIIMRWWKMFLTLIISLHRIMLIVSDLSSPSHQCWVQVLMNKKKKETKCEEKANIQEIQFQVIVFNRFVFRVIFVFLFFSLYLPRSMKSLATENMIVQQHDYMFKLKSVL